MKKSTTLLVPPRLARFLLIGLLSITCADLANAAVTPAAQHHSQKKRNKKLKKAEWAGAGFAAGKTLGPVGSATVGAAKYRKDLKAGGPRATRAATKIGAPIAAGAIAGPAGTAGYEAVEHRHWIKRHILRLPWHR